MNNYFVYATMLVPESGEPYVQEHLIRVEKTGKKFSRKISQEVAVEYYYRLAKVLTGGEIPADRLREFTLPTERVMDFPDDEAAMLWYQLRG